MIVNININTGTIINEKGVFLLELTTVQEGVSNHYVELFLFFKGILKVLKYNGRC
ncbi:hypothetical protein [Neobacillus ginsengisoli]|uniref:Uncharacterized protein n=1 Tax=Neobacillus ginsengisoli TaxID=904295 RepID=A0ABT9XYI5_9BACI|nr:hypothetical protein [Neobacillus ginsengisoli]MDQ0199977.1 hypothetical protein [Neobacillus ginsengisoli]